MVGGATVVAGAAVVAAQQQPRSQSPHATASLPGMNTSITSSMDQRHRLGNSHSKHLSICFW